MALLRKCLGKKPDDKDGEESDEELEEEGYQRRNSLQMIQHKRTLYCFIARVLIAKIIQHLIAAAYVTLILSLPKYYSNLPSVYVSIPLSIWFLIFVWVHFVDAAPNYLISIFLLILSSLCCGYFIAEMYHVIQLYFMFLPATLACLLFTNILFLPFMFFSKLWLNLRRIWIYLIPQFLNLGLNIIIIVAYSFTLARYGKEEPNHFQIFETPMRSKLDAIFILCIPTLFWSFSLNLLMVNKIKGVVSGQLYFVSHQKGDFLFAPLYFV